MRHITRKTTNPWRLHMTISAHRRRRFMRKIDRFNVSPDVCWVDLVLWDALDHGKPLARLVDEQTSFDCKREASRCGACYCGKFATQQAVDQCRAEFNTDYAPFIVEATS